jgi:tetratricopeptide (TPR) repeat protein
VTRALVPAALVAALAAALPAGAQVKSIASYADVLGRLDDELTRVERLYQGDIELGFRRTFDDRVSAGELYYLLGEYDKASTILFGAIEPPTESRTSVQERAGYADALYQLADSLKQLGNYAAARTYFEELLRLPRHPFRTQAISGLLTIADRLDDYRNIDEYYRLYKEASGGTVPSDVRYVHAKSLFLAKRDADAVDELSQIAPGDPFYSRARYLIGATFVRAGDLVKAAEIFEDLVKQPIKAKEDEEVRELAHMARGRLYYETDKLNEAIDAYQYVGWDSDQLATMLYEVTWTYVRRGQLALRDTEVVETDRLKNAAREYALALVQLDDLRLLVPEEDGQADIDLLRGNLELQRADFPSAEGTFQKILDEYRAADTRMGEMLNDPERRQRVLQDILAVEQGGLSVDSELPPVAVKRAAEDEDVADAIRVFKEIRQSQAELAATEKKLKLLEELLEAANRGERFPQLRSGFARAYTIDNNTLRVLGGLADLAAARVGERGNARLASLTGERRALQARLEALPNSGEGLEERKERFDDGYVELEKLLYELQLVIDQLRSELTAVDLLYQQSKGSLETSPRARERTKRRLQDLRAAVDEHEAEAQKIRDELERAKLDNTVSGGRGSSERTLRDIFVSVVVDELEVSRGILGGDAVDIERVAGQARSLRERQQGFLARLNGAADSYINDVRRVVLEEKGNLALYQNEVSRVATGAGAIREDATAIALEHVRRQLHDVVLRSDVGIIDVAFSKKQAETEKIGRLQRAKSEELTELNQAYADLTADEAD